MKSNQELKLKISVSLQTVLDSKQVTADLSIINASSNRLWVNKRLLVNTEHSPKAFREIWFFITSPEGKKLEFNCKVKAGSSQANDYLILEPGKDIKSTTNLSDCFNFMELGTYKIIAYYQDGNDKAPKPPMGTKHFNQLVESAIAEVNLQINAPIFLSVANFIFGLYLSPIVKLGGFMSSKTWCSLVTFLALVALHTDSSYANGATQRHGSKACPGILSATAVTQEIQNPDFPAFILLNELNPLQEVKLRFDAPLQIADKIQKLGIDVQQVFNPPYDPQIAYFDIVARVWKIKRVIAALKKDFVFPPSEENQGMAVYFVGSREKLDPRSFADAQKALNRFTLSPYAKFAFSMGVGRSIDGGSYLIDARHNLSTEEIPPNLPSQFEGIPVRWDRAFAPKHF